jgi:hypothetical protein
MNILDKTIAACNAIKFPFEHVGINCVVLTNGQTFSPAFYTNDALKLLLHARTLPMVREINITFNKDSIIIQYAGCDYAPPEYLEVLKLSDNPAQDVRDAVLNACIKLGEL